MSTFERYLTVWVAICIVLGITLGWMMPSAFQAIGAIEVSKGNLPVALLDQLEVALILDRREFLPDGEFTMLQAVDRLGEEQVRVTIAVERAMMLDMDDEQE